MEEQQQQQQQIWLIRINFFCTIYFCHIFKDFLHIHTVAVPVQLYVRSADLC